MTETKTKGSAMRIITMSQDDVENRLGWARHLDGYTIDERNAAAFWAADPGGFFGVQVHGSLEGTLAAVKYSPAFGFSGLYHMRPAVTNGSPKTRLGVVRVLQAAMEHFGTACVGTEGDDHKEGQYNRILKFHRAWVTARYHVDVKTLAEMPAIAEARQGTVDPYVRPAEEMPFEDLAAYDASHFGARRDGFLRHWLTDPGHRAWIFIDPTPEGDVLRGLAVIRPWQGGWQIGPLFADDAEIADALFRQCVGGVSGGVVCLDVPEVNSPAVALARSYGMSSWLTTTRMYRNGDPGLPVARIFGVTTLELG